MIKVNVGCGKNYIPGWVNIDLFSTVKADHYADLSALPFERESVSILYCSHLLEHVHRAAVLATLSYWRSLLAPDGILRLAVPDFSAVCQWYRKTGCLDDVIGLLYGRQDFPLNRHTIAFDKKTLTRDLKKVGFETIREWDWRATDHAKYDDYSQARLPHMSESMDATWVSLNLEAIK